MRLCIWIWSKGNPMGDMGDLWNDVRAVSKERRAKHREHGPNVLEDQAR